jgi:N-methylhydantoinase A/oxoprolinase/acetone carboxylase beta subunit
MDEFVSVDEKRKKNELATLRLHARGEAPISVFTEGKCGGEDPSSARIGEREVIWGGEKIITPIFIFEKLQRGAIVNGPAIIESMDTTIPVVEGTLLRVDALGNGIIGSKKSDISK